MTRKTIGFGLIILGLVLVASTQLLPAPDGRGGSSVDAEPLEKGILLLDPQPWARVLELRPLGEERDIPLAKDATPMRLELPAGRYEARLLHPEIGERSVELEVPPAGTIRFDESMGPTFVASDAASRELP